MKPEKQIEFTQKELIQIFNFIFRKKGTKIFTKYEYGELLKKFANYFDNNEYQQENWCDLTTWPV